VYFSRGVVQFWYRDFNDAVENLKRVTASAPELDLNTATTAWLRLGQTYDLLGQRPLAEQAYRSGIALAPQSEQARECRGYLSSPYKRKI
jgi:Flp pilus assembly protein TadD